MVTEFLEWLLTTRRTSALAVMISIINFIFLGASLLLIKYLLTQNKWELPYTDSKTLLLLLFLFFLIWINLSQSISSKLVSKLTLFHLQKINQSLYKNIQRRLMNERFLLEGWTNLLVNTIQFFLFLLLILYLGGLIFILGYLLSLPVLFLLSYRYYLLAKKFSLGFLDSQSKLKKQLKHNEFFSESERQAHIENFLISIYKRDVYTFRLPYNYNIYSLIALFLPLTIITIASSDAELQVTILLSALILRSQLFAYFDSIGRFSWVLSIWAQGQSEIKGPVDEI